VIREDLMSFDIGDGGVVVYRGRTVALASRPDFRNECGGAHCRHEGADLRNFIPQISGGPL